MMNPLLDPDATAALLPYPALAEEIASVLQDDAVQQCWRVSPGPDFVLVVQAADMPDYLTITQRLLTQDANVRNVKAFFATKRAKFTSTWPVLRHT